MWKLIVGFILFAALGMFVIFKGGDKLDMAGEASGSGQEVSHEAAASAPVLAAAVPASAAASAP